MIIDKKDVKPGCIYATICNQYIFVQTEWSEGCKLPYLAKSNNHLMTASSNLTTSYCFINPLNPYQIRLPIKAEIERFKQLRPDIPFSIHSNEMFAIY